MQSEATTQVLIVGGGTGGVAAALAAARRGGRCIITEPTDWIGGQLTSQAVPPDENRWIEGAQGVQSATRSYLEFRRRVRQWYRQHRALNDAARNDPHLNPGNGWVSRLCCEPRIAHAVLQEMLAPFLAEGRITILLHHQPIAADVTGDRVRSVTFRNTQSAQTVTIRADYFLDASELGDLYPLAGVEYMAGAEGRDDFGEMHATTRDPRDFQAISWCFAIEHRPGENHVIDRPARYEFWRNYIPPLDHPWPGRLFSWTVCGTEDHQPRTFRFIPWPDEPSPGEWEMWRYRRIVDRSIYRPEAQPLHPDVCLVNMVQMDYFQRPIIDVPEEQKQLALAEAREQSLCLLYWMQTEDPGLRGLKLRGEELGTSDGFAKAPYIREARRLRARTIITEAHVGLEQRAPLDSAEPFADSVGIGHYRLDLHPSTGMRIGFYVRTAPFRIPMGALIPQRVRNVLAAGKALGVTHITNGCYRLHPIEWNIGESAGALAVHCLEHHTEPHAVHDNIDRIRQFQKSLIAEGFPLAWPWEHGAGLCSA
ncbi:FAD-dependent oxidoreductase [Fontivita pretiosa]|uniref:FAD-dependent oxidoreductase n=1 Tax=Fontivita pretiosa TaxID=2989684 RepID=UPI003D17D308